MLQRINWAAVTRKPQLTANAVRFIRANYRYLNMRTTEKDGASTSLDANATSTAGRGSIPYVRVPISSLIDHEDNRAGISDVPQANLSPRKLTMVTKDQQQAIVPHTRLNVSKRNHHSVPQTWQANSAKGLMPPVSTATANPLPFKMTTTDHLYRPGQRHDLGSNHAPLEESTFPLVTKTENTNHTGQFHHHFLPSHPIPVHWNFNEDAMSGGAQRLLDNPKQPLLSENFIRAQITTKDDQNIIFKRQKLGLAWSEIARDFQGWSPLALRKRFSNRSKKVARASNISS